MEDCSSLKVPVVTSYGAKVTIFVNPALIPHPESCAQSCTLQVVSLDSAQ